MYDEIKDIPAIIMNGLTNQQVLKIMRAIKDIDGLPKTIFATVTPTSSQWKLEDLVKELQQEDIEMKKVSKSLKETKVD
ncbi:MAG: hypothetical protein PWP28_2022 [Oceanotoga sp.]|uniref:DUF3783 domain-containing protein n=1 Tax=Oceanotoga sp. TaxID=2108366 RepID=UPI00264FCAA1|nr:DUF3783 domain-containing protein [Oceanotoga sp.]MDN5343147.1 hypothetical protein [Oceanotoga sp.]